MPVYAVKRKGKIVGYRWGRTGKIYKTKAEAERQGRAIRASGYKESLIERIIKVITGEL